MTPSDLRVLLVAENASRRLGGEAILPYHYFRLLRARGVDAYLIVHERTRSELNELFPNDLARLRFVRDQPLQKLFFHLGKLLPHRIAEATFGLANQLLTQSAQRPIVRELVTQNTVVHQPIPVSPRFPSRITRVGAPVVCGPMNGGMTYPFAHAEGALSRILIRTARAFSDLFHRVVRGKLDAAVLLVANARTAAALPSGVQGNVIELVENGVDLDQWKPSDASIDDVPSSTFVFIGRLVDWKRLDIALEALAQLHGARLDVIGEGPMRAAWTSLADSLGLRGRVSFLGWQTQTQCAEHLRGSCGLLLPSIFECGGAVVLEAMAAGRPVIATAWGGPVDYLDSTCGILVEPASPAALVAGFRDAMHALITSPQLIVSLGAAGGQRARTHFDWQRKIDQIIEIYKTVLN